eukprot:CAMPEP_0180515674 /NCGR_PEP_ID=MMETSP1036_2-20121128/53455_1 /TAXON_ID=632150 /ORGANISM="Azadinium spinosum, Strain 3D9" /LENGTH=58 /DNA_ID=CAMNT_0022527311 /DNA_START=82 /DNA_END=255 /DNA_ORIENTATION=+
MPTSGLGEAGGETTNAFDDKRPRQKATTTATATLDMLTANRAGIMEEVFGLDVSKTDW